LTQVRSFIKITFLKKVTTSLKHKRLTSSMQKITRVEKVKITSFPRDTLEQAEIVKIGWKKVGEKLEVPNLDIDKFVSKLNEAREYAARAEELKMQRALAIQERNIFLSELWDLTKRVRNSAKATFGDYSQELEILVSTKKARGVK